MAFEKGRSGNPKGRPRGAKGRNTDIRRWLTDALQDGQELFVAYMAELDPPEYIKAYLAMMSYAVAKPQSISPVELINAEYEALGRLLETAPEEAIQELAARVAKMKIQWRERKQLA